MNRIIITGGNGFIGRHLAKKILAGNTHSLVLISHTANANDKYLAYRKLSNDKRLTFYTADIRAREAISQIIANERADTCIHLAAKTSVIDSMNRPKETMDTNVKGTENVLEACYENEVKNFVFASSAAVYGDARELPISENHTLRPLSPYGTSKMLAEKYVSSYGQLKKIQNTVSLRIFNAYGPGQASESDFITKFAKRLSNGLPPIIYGDGNSTRDFISVDDITEAIVLSVRAMELPENSLNDRLRYPAVLNVGTGIPTSIDELAQKMIDIFGLKLSPEYEQGNNSHGAILHSYASTSKAKRALNFVAKATLDTGLRSLVKIMHTSKGSSKDRRG